MDLAGQVSPVTPVGGDTRPRLEGSVPPRTYRDDMRLLHTSDWHLGRSFHREDLLGAQAQFIDFLVETVVAAQVDVVVVSGDIYDRALPSVDAVSLCNEALRRLADTGARTVLISGNHDSARRLGFGADLIDAAGIHLRTDPSRVARPVLLDDPDGPVAVYAFPYLEPDAVRAELLGDDDGDRGHTAVLRAAMGRVHDDLAGRGATRSVVLAHAFVAGGEASDSERDISVGGVSVVPASVFDGVDYTALGHLHGAQAINERVRYSGSPIAYSFGEEHQHKAVLLVDLPPTTGGAVRVASVAAPVHRPLTRIRGAIDDLLTGGRWADVAGHYLQVTLTDPQRPREAMSRLRSRFPHTLVLGFEPEGAERDDASYVARLRGRSDLEVATDFVAHVRGDADVAERALLGRALESTRARERAG
ncbi:MAG: repair protein SbcD/Mre11 [Actinomycetota bacterium]|nr:repair protein SbcD/Mre11 [Actinomycetota bacterium]